jgi:hypothetical protein
MQPVLIVVQILTTLLVASVAASATLERVEVVNDRGVVVRLHCSEPVAAQTQTLPARLGFLNRLAIDLPGTRLGTSARGVAGGRGPVLRVLTEQLDGSTVRVTIDLEDEATFAMGGHGRVVEVRVADQSAARTPPPTIPRVRQPGL